MNTKRRCTSCRDYFPREQISRHGVCGAECLQTLVDKAREKHRRRQIQRERPSPTGAGSDVRRRVRVRDGEKCRWCGTSSDLQVHHIKYRSEGGPNTMNNLITLCAEHHATAHSNKRLYQPALLGVIWMGYVGGKMLSVPQFMRWHAALLPAELEAVG